MSPLYLQAQNKKDSVEKKFLAKRAFRQGMKFITTSPEDTIVNKKSADDYARFAGKIIRSIHYERVGFEISIYDSTKRVRRTVTKIANAIHTDTRQRIIQQHLFLEKNKPLNPAKLADNERFLRDKDFILDSRIMVVEGEGSDSVDLVVITRDVFSLGTNVGGSFPNALQLGLYDANVGGLGQRFEFNTLIDQDRTPKFGYSLLYRKSSIFGSLTNVELGYTQINSGISLGDESEFATRIRISRPLVSPYSRLAGALEISRNWSKNIFTKPDSAFLDYKYKILDGWIGYNLGIKNSITNRNRHFLAFRAFDYYYLNRPRQENFRESVIYNNSSAYLSAITFYRQNFFKTRYVFGFGRTEDVPSGFSMELTSGYVRQLKAARPYSAFNINYSLAHRKGDFQSFRFQSGGYYRNNRLEDVILDAGTTYYTRLWQFQRFKMRSSVSANYSKLVNHNVVDWLTVRDNEINGLIADSLKFNTRLALHLESVLFTPWSFIGFRMAPFWGVDMVSAQCITCENKNNTFWGFNSGLRTRNENLIFGTLELKLSYIPKDEFGTHRFVIGFKQNLRVKSSGTFVKAPSLISYN
ncbi:MAG: hypothetical protein JNM78_06275 [Cyclobacteriaceae bacterium]|nr:hypothetical protein [Cyclobacteriaceae bacterium]